MKDADDFHRIRVNAIDSEIGKAAEDKLACVLFSSGPSRLGKLCEQIKLAMDGDRHAARPVRTTMGLDVVADMSKVANGRIRPADLY
jgi:hypothetical protein